MPLWSGSFPERLLCCRDLRGRSHQPGQGGSQGDSIPGQDLRI